MIATSMPHLRPFLSSDELLDQAIRLYRHKFLTFIGLVAVVLIPITILQMILSLLSSDNIAIWFADSLSLPTLSGLSYYAGIGETYLLPVINFILVSGVASAALARAVAGSYSGESIGIIAAYRQIGPSLLSLLGTFVLAGVCLIGLVYLVFGSGGGLVYRDWDGGFFWGGDCTPNCAHYGTGKIEGRPAYLPGLESSPAAFLVEPGVCLYSLHLQLNCYPRPRGVN